MKNSKIKIIALAFVAISSIATLSGCKKYLDQQPITELGPATVFSDVASVREALVGVYSRLTGDNGYGRSLSLYFPVDNDEMMGPSGTNEDRRSIARMNPVPTNPELTSPFNQLFKGIEFANICIDKIPQMDMYNNGNDQQKKQLRRMLGEALTLRAQFYFEAIRNWGDLPSHFQPAYLSALDNPLPGETGRDSLYTRLVDDLKVASDLVPWRNELGAIGDVQDERITKGTVKGLRARIALYAGGYSLRGVAPALGTMERPTNYLTFYQIARDECDDIIKSGQHGMNPSYKALWKDYVCAHAITDPDGELMFQVTGAERGGAADTKLGYYNGPRLTNAAGTVIGNAAINPLPTYFYTFDSTDQRLFVTIAPYNIAADGQTKVGTAITAMNDGKYRRDWVTNPTPSTTDLTQYLGLKWQILRYSDILLMYAEADNEINGPTPLAIERVNMVRRRGFGKPIGTPSTIDLPTSMSKSEFFNKIVSERSFELGGEGMRKFDLIRWNLLETRILEVRADLTAFAAGTGKYVNTPTRMFYKNNSTADDKSLWANSFYSSTSPSTMTGATSVTWRGSAISTNSLVRFASGYTKGKSELMPLPSESIGANPNLKQNPGYQ